MRVRDAKNAVHGSLQRMAWRQYLAAMWILCDELRVMYEEWLRDEGPLIESTMDVVRQVAATGESRVAAKQAKKLANAWRKVYTAGQAGASAGLLNVWATFEALSQEIGGLCGRYDGANWVLNAATERWRVENPNDHRPIVVDRNEVADDASLIGQTLIAFQRIVDHVTEVEGPDWDPVMIRTQIFDDR